MAIVVVTSATPGAGKTGVATAIARHYAYQGRPVRLVRLAGEGSAEACAHDFESGGRRQDVGGACAGMIGMAVRDKRAGGSTGRVDMKIAGGAIEPGRRDGQDGACRR